MGPQAAVNAVFYNQIQAIEDEAEREASSPQKREEYAEDIDILHLASELVVDAVVEPGRAARRPDPPLRAWPPARTAPSPSAATRSRPPEAAAWPPVRARYRFGRGAERQSPARGLPRLRRRASRSLAVLAYGSTRCSTSTPSCSASSRRTAAPAPARSRPASSCSAISLPLLALLAVACGIALLRGRRPTPLAAAVRRRRRQPDHPAAQGRCSPTRASRRCSAPNSSAPNAFPSGHTTAVASIAIAFAFVVPRELAPGGGRCRRRLRRRGRLLGDGARLALPERRARRHPRRRRLGLRGAGGAAGGRGGSRRRSAQLGSRAAISVK